MVNRDEATVERLRKITAGSELEIDTAHRDIEVYLKQLVAKFE